MKLLLALATLFLISCSSTMPGADKSNYEKVAQYNEKINYHMEQIEFHKSKIYEIKKDDSLDQTAKDSQMEAHELKITFHEEKISEYKQLSEAELSHENKTDNEYYREHGNRERRKQGLH